MILTGVLTSCFAESSPGFFKEPQAARAVCKTLIRTREGMEDKMPKYAEPTPGEKINEPWKSPVPDQDVTEPGDIQRRAA